jgi:hypothetical protein
MLSGSVTYLRGTRKKRVPLFSVVSLSALATFAEHTDEYSNASVSRVSVTRVQDVTGEQAAEYGDFDNYYAVFRFRNTAPEEGENPTREYHLADPNAAEVFELNTDGKYVVKAAVGEQFAAWYSAATGKTYEFVKGWLWGG